MESQQTRALPGSFPRGNSATLPVAYELSGSDGVKRRDQQCPGYR